MTENTNMAAKTANANAYTPEATTDRIEISTANLGFLTTESSMKVFTNNCDDDCKVFPPTTANLFPVPRLALTSHTVSRRRVVLHLFCHELGGFPSR